jgi:CDP-paratose 2-epimerase
MPGTNGDRPLALVTGGAGFVGTNLTTRLVRDGWRVRVLDTLSRPGVEQNFEWLRSTHASAVAVTVADVRDAAAVRRAVDGADAVFHLAAQVAVTTSVERPWLDFDVNARGTLTVLEELRRLPSPPPLLFTSTNKVYGALEDVELELHDERWDPVDPELRARGIAETRPLDFCTPYGCSKGAADQYVLDFAKTYGIPAVVFRMSCIYGPHQQGNEDQGWVAHFLLQVARGLPITIYGDGAQVRDVLFVDDLVDAMLVAIDRAHELRGTAFNIGGGPDNAVSLLAVVDAIAELTGDRPALTFAETRVGDQRYYVSDTSRFGRACGWRPRVGVSEGLDALHAWTRRGATVPVAT